MILLILTRPYHILEIVEKIRFIINKNYIISVFIRLPAVLHEAPAGLLLRDPGKLLAEVEPASEPAGLGQTSGENQLREEKHPADTEGRGAETRGGEQGQVQQALPTSQEEEDYTHSGKLGTPFLSYRSLKYSAPIFWTPCSIIYIK